MALKPTRAIPAAVRGHRTLKWSINRGRPRGGAGEGRGAAGAQVQAGADRGGGTGARDVSQEPRRWGETRRLEASSSERRKKGRARDRTQRAGGIGRERGRRVRRGGEGGGGADGGPRIGADPRARGAEGAEGPQPAARPPGSLPAPLTARVGPEGHAPVALHQVRPLEAVLVLEAAVRRSGRDVRGARRPGAASRAVAARGTADTQQQSAEQRPHSGPRTPPPGPRHLGLWETAAGASGRGGRRGRPTGRSLIGGAPGARVSPAPPPRSGSPPDAEHRWAGPWGGGGAKGGCRATGRGRAHREGRGRGRRRDQR